MQLKMDAFPVILELRVIGPLFINLAIDLVAYNFLILSLIVII